MSDTIFTLQKVLQESGFDSRRNIRQYIAERKFKVNGETAKEPGFPVDPHKDTITFKNKPIKIRLERKVYYVFNKPYGVVSTLSDPQHRATISEFIRKIPQRVYPVGRLDYHSEGLILLTNDGDLTNFIISPRNSIPKVYLVKIKGALSDATKYKLQSRGMVLDGRRINPVKIENVKKTQKGNSWIKVTITEGKKHIIRKVFKYSGHPVEKLKRVSIGNIQLKKLLPGHWREVTVDELEAFKRKFKYED